MRPHTHPLRRASALLPLACFAALLLAALACSLPQGALPTPTPTRTAQPSASPTPAVPTASLTPTTTAPLRTPTPLPPRHYIALRWVFGVASFRDQRGDRPFSPRGANYFYLVPAVGGYENRLIGVSEFDPQRIYLDFGQLKQAGYNTVRVIFDLCQPGPECIVVDGEDRLNPAYLENLALLTRLAHEQGLMLILASNDLPPGSSYARQAAQGAGPLVSPGRNASLLTTQGIQAAQAYWDELISGLLEHQASFGVLLGWELLSEAYYMADAPPFSLAEGRLTAANGQTYNLALPADKQRLAVDGLRYYIQQMRQTILRYDPEGLVTMGFFAPTTPHAWRGADPRYVETEPLLDESELDFFDFHLYPGSSLSQAELTENFGMAGHSERPILMGETGAYTALYPTVESAARALQDWIAASCEYGFDGWLAWGYYRAPGELGDTTWGFRDEDGLLMRALSPEFQPDPCTPTILRGDNLALGKPVQASAARADFPAEAAVDGIALRWNSGQDAPQWIELDLGGAYTIGSVRLTVDQWPDGETTHEIWAAGERGELRRLATLQGWTSDGQVLEWAPDQPLSAVRRLRIITTTSPSWVGWEEIEVLAP